jgi:hypothetical protein
MLSLASTTLWNAAHQLSVPKVVIGEVVCAVAQDMGQRTKPLEPVHMRPGWKADPRYRNVLSPVPIGRSGICGQPMDCHITGKPETTTWLTARYDVNVVVIIELLLSLESVIDTPDIWRLTSSPFSGALPYPD